VRSRNPLSLAPEPQRYPLALAACWIGGCGVVDAAAGGALRAEPFYLPAILILAWLYGLREGLVAALGAAVVASVAEFATSSTANAGILYWNFVAHAVLLALPAWLVAALREQQRQLAGLVNTDAATGFATRQGLIEALAAELVRTERLGGETSIVCISLNGLPRLATERGPEHAGMVLRGFCDAVRVSARRIDTLARLADDEFALLLRGTASDAAAGVADKLVNSLTDWLLTQGYDLSCSVGFSTAPRGRRLDAEALLARAVAHLYERRATGPAPQRAATAVRSPATAVISSRESA
jgi:diguanylate cyclase (GGDEF)-like protein